MKKLFFIIVMAVMAVAASAQSLQGIWRWETDNAAYKFLEFKSNGIVQCSDYATFTIEDEYTIMVTGWARWQGTYKKTGNQLTITNKPATLKCEISDLQIYPEVSRAEYTKIKQAVMKQLQQASKGGISARPEKYRIDVFTNDQLQMQLGYDMVYYWRTNSYNVTE